MDRIFQIKKSYLWMLAILTGISTINVNAEQNDTGERFKQVEITDDNKISSVPADSISFTQDGDKFCLKPGETMQLPYQLSPENTDEKPVWSIVKNYNDSVTVNENGGITAVNVPGEAQINASIANGNSITFTVYTSEDPEYMYFGESSYVVKSGTSKDIVVNVPVGRTILPQKNRGDSFECHHSR